MQNRRSILAAGLGLLASAAWTGSAHAGAAPRLPAGLGAGRKVLVLGAGVSGLACAYEFERAGFDVTVLEARQRVGGKVWTIRPGDRIEMEGRETQTCAFAEGLYFNAGAARLPSQHARVLDYCKALGVRMEPEVNISQTARFQSARANGGQPLEQRRATFDMRGYIAELLGQALNGGALDARLGPEERTRLSAYLRSFGDLDRDGLYKGSVRSGYADPPGPLGHAGVGRPAAPLADLLANPMLGQTQYADAIFNQPTMLQPVGGMDAIPRALAKALRRPPVLGAEVTRIETSATSATAVWRDAAGRSRSLTADFLVATIPLPVMSGVANNFDAAVNAAIRAPHVANASKVAFDAPRFWEAEDIYGGLSFVDSDATVLWYPSGELMRPRGVLVGAYAFVPGAADRMHERTTAQAIGLAREAVEAVHPGRSKLLANPLFIDWARVPYSRAPWLSWTDQRPAFERLNRAHGRVWFAGAHLSELDHWQEGAIASAHRVVELIAAEARQA